MTEPSWQGIRGTRHERGYGEAWTKLRLKILDRDGYLCQECYRNGRVTPLGIAPYDHACDHIIPKAYGGNDHPSNLQSLCAPCHDAKSIEEKQDAIGYRRSKFDSDGFPVWGEHERKWGYSIPDSVRPSAIPVVLVSGPPAAGKTTYVERNAKPHDTVIDLDKLMVYAGGVMWDQRPDILRAALRARDGAIHGLRRRKTGTAYLIVTAPTEDERKTWAKALGDVTIKVMQATEAECIARIKANPDRAEAAEGQIEAVKRWFRHN